MNEDKIGYLIKFHKQIIDIPIIFLIFDKQ